jgi:hypothetical protein
MAKKQPEALPRFQPRDPHAKTHRNLPGTEIRSEQEGYFRTGVFTSAADPTDVTRGMGRRQYPLFAADAQLLRHEDTNCTKKQYSSGRLSPGLMVRCPPASRAVCPADRQCNQAALAERLRVLQRARAPLPHSADMDKVMTFVCRQMCSSFCCTLHLHG